MLPSFIIMAKLIPPGVESSMMSFTTTIIALNQFIIRNMLAVAINNNFVFVTKKNMKAYSELCLIAFVMSFIPMLFLYCMTPTIKECDDK